MQGENELEKKKSTLQEASHKKKIHWEKIKVTYIARDISLFTLKKIIC
jgi:hypothetical protein